jgi:hypothetical protein
MIASLMSNAAFDGLLIAWKREDARGFFPSFGPGRGLEKAVMLLPAH